MCWTQKFSFSADPVILDLKLQLAALVVSICPISPIDIIPRVVCIFPLCCHTFNEIELVLFETFNIFKENNPLAQVVNVATDGDHFRRKIFEKMRKKSSNRFFQTLLLFCDNFIEGELTSNLDPMHVVKRYRGQVITPKRDIILVKRSINRSHIEKYLPELKPLLYNHDYQNVPYADKLLTGLSNIKLKPIPKDTLYHQIYNELICLAEVVTPLLNIFVNPKISLIYQLEQLSYCAHLLFYNLRKWKTAFITKDLYMVNLYLLESFFPIKFVNIIQ